MADENPFAQFAALPSAEDANPFSQFAMRSPQPEEPASPTQPELTWGDAAKEAVGNIPSSAVQLVKNVATPFLHPVQTAESLYDLGKGVVSKVAGAVGVTQDPEEKAKTEASADAVGKFFADRYGGIDAFKNTLAHDPVGLVADLSAVLTGGGALAARAPGVIGTAARAAGSAGSVIDPIINAGRALGKGTSAGLHLVTGLGDNVLETAAKAGAAGNRTFLDNMRGNVAPTDVIDLAKSALDQMRSERGAAYRAGMAGVKADPTQLDYSAINQALQDAASNVNFNGIAKSKKAAKTLQKVQDVVQQWQSMPPGTPFHTAEGFDALKQAVNEIRMGTDPGTLSRNIADSVYNATKGTIVKQAPSYADTMLGYSEASDKLNELLKTFSLGEKASPDTTLRKLQSVTRNNVNTNYGQRTRLMDDLAKYEPDLLPALAGQATSTLLPRGLARLGAHGALGAGAAYMSPATLPLLLASSPRIAGETAYATGRGLGAVKKAANAAGVSKGSVAPTLRLSQQVGRGLSAAPLVEPVGLVGGIGPRYDENGNLIAGQE